MPSVNVAASVNGGVATASSTISSSFPVENINDGDLASPNWGGGSPDGGWNSADASSGTWVQIDFDGSYVISQIDAVALQADYSSSTPPVLATTAAFDIMATYKVQYWNGSSWIDVGALDFSSSGSAYAYNQATGLSLTTTALRVLFLTTPTSYFRWVELQAWTDGGGGGATWPGYLAPLGWN